MIKVIDALGSATEYSYGGSGCPSCGGGGGDKLTSITDANGNTIRFAYDQLGRKTKEIDSLGNVTSYTYDSKGNILTRTDANGRVTSFTYDPTRHARHLPLKLFNTLYTKSVAPYEGLAYNNIN